MCISQESGPHTRSPSPILKAAGAEFHAASNFSASLTKAHWRHPVGVYLVWLMSETRYDSSSSLPRWDDWDGQALLTDAPERRAALWTIMAAVRAQPFLTRVAKIKSTHAVMKLHSKALPCVFWAQGCAGLNFPRRRRQLLQQGSLVPS